MYDAARDATSTNEKKVTLENLGEYLFECLKPCKCRSRDLQSQVGEFDRVFDMEDTPYPLFQPWAPHFVLEAKNWKKKIGQPLVQAFGKKLDESHCRVGVYLSMTLYTRDACDDVRRQFPGTHVFLLHGSHIEQVIGGLNLIEILEELRFELQFKPKRLSISARQDTRRVTS